MDRKRVYEGLDIYCDIPVHTNACCGRLQRTLDLFSYAIAYDTFRVNGGCI